MTIDQNSDNIGIGTIYPTWLVQADGGTAQRHVGLFTSTYGSGTWLTVKNYHHT